MKKLIPVKKNRQALITPMEIIFLRVIPAGISLFFFIYWCKYKRSKAGMNVQTVFLADCYNF